MKSICETVGDTYQRQGNDELANLQLQPEEECHIGVWGNGVEGI